MEFFLITSTMIIFLGLIAYGMFSFKNNHTAMGMDFLGGGLFMLHVLILVVHTGNTIAKDLSTGKATIEKTYIIKGSDTLNIEYSIKQLEQ